ncbi:MAG: preprotein translocase subunit SecA [Candidatus Omnitrophica bacterium]|nr:preprotein translocase subunit SecA [Candidatus Omnitrophota bacterium]
MIGFLIKKIIGTQNERALKKMQPIVDKVNGFEPATRALSDDALKAKTPEFRSRLEKGETLDDILPEAFAVVREVGRRTVNMRHFDVQLIGGIVLHQGKIAEMATGEGKTLVATLAAYLNALGGKGVHVITVNDYLAKRDRSWMGPIYEFLGLTIGVIQHDMDFAERKHAYHCDITYGTNNEFGFDYLRDNMVRDLEFCVQRKLNYAVVDEVDSILIDEARTPLIISGPAEKSTEKYYLAKRAADAMSGRRVTDTEAKEAKAEGVNLGEGYDYVAEEKTQTISLTEAGEEKAAKFLRVESLHESDTIEERHHTIAALRAKEFFHRDVEYVIKEGKVIIVDEFTGRLMPGRRWSDGLHQAVESKEGLEIERENQTLATITFQNYFRMYEKLSGMTGTAATEAIEFEKIYKLGVVVVPTNRPLIRTNYADCIYKTEKEKFNAAVNEIIAKHSEGRPVLVGTVSIEKSELLSHLLKRRGVPHSVLNAKYHEREAEIVALAGQEGTITIATNMAGRGTDIVLGKSVAEKGGLHVIGTERHEARRIDNQLRGRSGRQGDPGSSQFYLSLEDDLMRLFGSDRIAGLMERLGMEEGQEIQHPFISGAIETAQKRVEARNFDIRKHLLDYDDVMNKQREIIYNERRRVLEGKEIRGHVLEMMEDFVETLILRYLNPDLKEEERDEDGFLRALKDKFLVALPEVPGGFSLETLKEEIFDKVKQFFEEKEKRLGADLMLYLARTVLLQIIDAKWKEHLHTLDELREGIHLRAYGQRDPLVEYQHEAFGLFDEMTESIKEEAIEFILKVEPVRTGEVRTVLDTIEQEYVHREVQGMKEVAHASKSPEELESPRHGGSLVSGANERPAEKLQPVKHDHPKVGRNDPCPCGSGKKYKKCCGK